VRLMEDLFKSKHLSIALVLTLAGGLAGAALAHFTEDAPGAIVGGALVAAILAFVGMLRVVTGLPRRDSGEQAAALQALEGELDEARANNDRLLSEVAGLREQVERIKADYGGATQTIEVNLERIEAGLAEQSSAVEQTTQSMRQITDALQEIAQHVETLASSAEESSSSILEMTATNDEVVENMSNLSNSVRETVSSIEEMAYSIKEVARNIDALSLTAEETSSSMNEMDV